MPLNIETDRYRNVSLPDRLCTLCDNSEVEDEIHFLCVCKFNSEYRSDMYNAVARSYAHFNLLDQFDKFVYLIVNEQKCVISFIAKSFLKRKHAMFMSYLLRPMYFLPYMPLCLNIFIYIYICVCVLLTHENTSVSNLQPYDYDCYDVFRVTYKPRGAG